MNKETRENEATAFQLNKANVFDALASAGVTTLTVSFDGYGDNGQVGDMTAQVGDHYADLPAVSITSYEETPDNESLAACETSIRHVVEELVYGCLEESYPGWEIDDGSFGEFTFDVSARKIRLDYNGRITEIVCETNEF